MRVQVVPPECGEYLRGHLVVFRLGQIHPALRRIFHDLGVVGDRPDQGGARPQLGRNLRLGIVVFGVRRRVVLEQVDQRQHQRAIGMIDDVGDQLAGGGLGLDAGDELAAWRAHHLDLDLGKALVERLDDLLFDLGEVRRVIDQLAFRLGRRDQFGRAEFRLRHRRRTGERQAKAGDAGHDHDIFLHSQSSLVFFTLFGQRCPEPPPSTAS